MRKGVKTEDDFSASDFWMLFVFDVSPKKASMFFRTQHKFWVGQGERLNSRLFSWTLSTKAFQNLKRLRHRILSEAIFPPNIAPWKKQVSQ